MKTAAQSEQTRVDLQPPPPGHRAEVMNVPVLGLARHCKNCVIPNQAGAEAGAASPVGPHPGPRVKARDVEG